MRPISPIPARFTMIKRAAPRNLRMYGNICYDSRDRYINFPWSSERK